jgi:hypothetical protein
MANPVVHFEIMARENVDQVRKFYADIFDWKIDANNPMNYGLVETGGEGIPRHRHADGRSELRDLLRARPEHRDDAERVTKRAALR